MCNVVFNQCFITNKTDVLCDIMHGKLQLAIWDASFWTFWVKFGHKGP